MTQAEAQRVDKILNDLVTSINTDIAPIIQPNRLEGGYFGVPRMVLCCIDFLGLLLEGWSGKMKKNGNIDDFANSDKARKYIQKVLSQVDNFYGKNGDLFYEMYRHGTVHLYHPKNCLLKNIQTRPLNGWSTKGKGRIGIIMKEGL